MKVGYFLSSEEQTAVELVREAQLAEDSGFEALWISDHFHPWNDEQGESTFVWSIIGAVSAVTDIPVTTAVTCPTVRIHPVIIAQAAATASLLTGGKFQLGVGSGEALNEHIFGDPWPNAETRQDMLREAVEVMRLMWTEDVVNFKGEYYTVIDARLYSKPEGELPVFVSGFGPKGIEMAAEIGDGFITVTPSKEDLQSYRKAGGKGPAQGGTKVSWAPTEDEGVKHAHRLWSTQGIPGEIAQVLPSPKQFQQAAALVTEDMTRDSVPCGPDPDRHLENARKYFDAGYDEFYVSQMGPLQDGFFEFYSKEIVPVIKSWQS